MLCHVANRSFIRQTGASLALLAVFAKTFLSQKKKTGVKSRIFQQSEFSWFYNLTKKTMPAAKTGTKSQSKSSIGCLLWQKAGKINGKRINKWGDQSSGKFLGASHRPLTTNFFSVCFLSLWLRLFQILSNNCSKFFHKKCSIKFSDLIEPLTLPLSAFYTMMVLGKLGLGQ